MSSPFAKCCEFCSKTEGKLLVCGQCKRSGKSGAAAAYYCSKDCQRKDWPVHKLKCAAAAAAGSSAAVHWSRKHQKCQGAGNNHFGKLELVSWEGLDDDGDPLGWGGVFEDEADELKQKFEVEFGGDEEKLFDYFQNAFRWTCCGGAGDATFGCDHHGDPRAPTGCSCDYCHHGQELPDELWKGKTNSSHAKGLKLFRGPDQRSVLRLPNGKTFFENEGPM